VRPHSNQLREQKVAEHDPILDRIQHLADEEHELREREAHGSLAEQDRLHLSRVEVQLDQAWDLLRQRRARREAGQDPDGAQLRDEGTVEGYRQ
jgi:Protein of unknown function (DUF2630)